MRAVTSAVADGSAVSGALIFAIVVPLTVATETVGAFEGGKCLIRKQVCRLHGGAQRATCECVHD